MPHRSDRGLMLALAAALALGGHAAAAQDRTLALRGLFCNGEDQLDAAVAGIGRGLHPDAAAEAVNRDAVHCTYVDLLQFMVEAPEVMGDRGAGPMARYRGQLVGVLVGGRLRPVMPAAEVFFVTPSELSDAVVERRL